MNDPVLHSSYRPRQDLAQRLWRRKGKIREFALENREVERRHDGAGRDSLAYLTELARKHVVPVDTFFQRRK